MTTKLRLWDVEVQTTVVVLAETREGAARIAQGIDRWDLDLDAFASPLRCLPYGWESDSLPFVDGDEDEERTVGEWVALGAAPEWKGKVSP